MAVLAALFGAGAHLFAQAVPTATAGPAIYNPGPSIPLIDGNFQYGLTASEIVQFGNYGTATTTGNTGTSTTAITSLSGNMEYISRSSVHPFSLLYSGGVLFSSYAGRRVSTFQTLTASQGLVRGRWAMGVSDSLSYLPQTGTTGLSGIPGVGDLGFQPTYDPSAPVQTVLTNAGRQISNTLSGNIQRELTGRTSITGTGSYGILRFIDGVGFSSDQIGGNLGISHQLDRRSSVSLGAQYTSYSYSGNSTSFQSRGLNVGYTRLLTKELSFNGSVGPQWTNSFTAQPLVANTTAPVQVPSRLGVSANVGLAYTHQYTHASIGYSRGVNSGSGLQLGSIADSVNAGVGRSWGRDWAGAITGAYSRTSGLVQVGNTSSFFGGTQITRRLGQNFSAYGSYTAVKQSIPSALIGLNAFSGLSQSIGVGVTFSPRRGARVGQF